MSWLRRFLNRWREDELGREFDAELRFDLENRTATNMRRGLNHHDAALEARRRLGNLTRAREEMRAARVATWFDGLDCDLRYAIRVFTRQPTITLLTVLMLSLGIGANAAVFSVFEAVLLRPLPYPAAERLTLLLEPGDGRGLTTPTVPEVLDIRNATRSFDAVTFFDTRDFQTTGGAEPERVVGARVETSLLTTLGVQASLGRMFDAADGAGRNSSIVVLGQGFWRRNFGSDPAVVGHVLSLNGEPYEIVGVASEALGIGPYLPSSVDLYLPYPSSPDYTSRTGEFANVRRVTALARLRPGVTAADAAAELRTVAAGIAAAHSDLYGRSGLAIVAQPLHEILTRNSRSVMLLLLGLVAVMLLIACVNTAQFLLAQAIEREPEIALRRALGASRSRLIRQCLSEVLLLAAAGGAAGVAQAMWLTKVLGALVPSGMSLVGRISLDGTALLFLFSLTVVCAVVSALAPARLFGSRTAERLESRTTTPRSGRLRHAFIATEVAMSVVLLTGAALLVRSLQELSQAQGGFSSDRVTVLRLRGIGGGGSLGDTYARYLRQLTTITGIEAAGLTNSVFPGRPTVSFTLADQAADTATLSRQQASYQIVSGGYFTALGIPLESGRFFTDDDDASRPRVAIVNREMAKRYWRGSAIGRQLHAGEGPRASTMTIVGIVGDVRPPFQIGDVPQMYVPYRQQSDPNAALIVRTGPGQQLPLPAIKQAIRTVEPRQAVFGVETVDAQLARAVSSQRAIATLTTGFAALAVVISVCGIYMVIAYLVRRRFKEIAVRRAIGAGGRDVLWSLAAPTLRWAALGLLVGAAGAVAATNALRAAIAGIVPLDLVLGSTVAMTYLSMVLLVITASARAALRIDPAAALRID